MIWIEENLRNETALKVASQMAAAARTAPKGKGRDTLSIIVLNEEDLLRLADKTEEIGKRTGMDFFCRDAHCLRKSHALLLIGTTIQPEGLKLCGLCGFTDCQDKVNKHFDVPCVFNNIDLGIAVGSAVSIAADNRVDSRVLYTVGMAALEMRIFDKSVKIILGIPISISSKSPFFDR